MSIACNSRLVGTINVFSAIWHIIEALLGFNLSVIDSLSKCISYYSLENILSVYWYFKIELLSIKIEKILATVRTLTCTFIS